MKSKSNEFGHFHHPTYSPNGMRMLALGSHFGSGRTLDLWNAQSGMKELELEFEGDRRSLELATARFGADGKEVIVLADEGWNYEDGIRVLNAVTGEQLFHLGQGQGYFDFDVSSAGSTLIALGSDSSSLQVWNYKTGSSVLCREFEKAGEPAAKISSDGLTLLLANEDRRPVEFIDTRTGSEIARTREGFWDGAFSPDTKRVVLWSDQIEMWDIASGNRLLEFGEGNLAGFSPDGRYIFTASYQDTWLKIWDGASGEQLHVFDKFRSGQWYGDWEHGTPGFSLDGRHVVTCEGQFAKVRSIETGDALHAFDCPNGTITSAAFRPDGKQLLVTSRQSVRTPTFSGIAPTMFTWNLPCA